MLHDVGNGGFVAFKSAAEDREGWRQRCQKPAVQQKTTDDDDDDDELQPETLYIFSGNVLILTVTVLVLVSDSTFLLTSLAIPVGKKTQQTLTG